MWDSSEFKEIIRGSTQAAVHFQVTSSEAASSVCLKVIKKEDVLSSEWDLAKEELEIHRSASGLPHVIPILFSERDEDQIIIAMPRADRGDLWDKVQYGGLALSENEAKHFASQLFHGLAELHQARIVHADIKPQNILLRTQGDRLCVALCDFGLSRYLPSEPGKKITFTEIRGTQGYISPEVCNGNDFDEKIDVFAAALVLYRLLAGIEPFYPAENFTEELEFPDDCCEHLSDECKEFLKSLLTLDPEQRLSAAEATEHPWLSNSVGIPQNEADSGNELGLRFWNRKDLEHVPGESKRIPKEVSQEENFFRMNALSWQSSASTRCPEDEDCHDLVDATVDGFWSRVKVSA
jgi:serine/threonine protein kinase